MLSHDLYLPMLLPVHVIPTPLTVFTLYLCVSVQFLIIPGTQHKYHLLQGAFLDFPSRLGEVPLKTAFCQQPLYDPAGCLHPVL